MHPAIVRIREAILGTPFEGDVFLVGGGVRDELLGISHSNDFDLVTRGDAPALAELLYQTGVSELPPVTYPRFGTAMLRVENCTIELVTARRESYGEESRKPTVEPASYLEDAQRRDFTVNSLLKDIATGEILDPLRIGRSDLKSKILRTPLDAVETFHDDPLRMLRAVRFRWQLGFEPAPGLYEAITQSKQRLTIVSFERIRDELFKILARRTASRGLDDLMSTGLMEIIAPEFQEMVGVEQGNFHHLDVWDHTRLVIDNLWEVSQEAPPLTLVLGALFHDVGKPPTRTVDAEGRTRFFGHEEVGAEMTRRILGRWKLSEKEITGVVKLVRNHMRLGSSPTFSKSAARRVLRDLGDQSDALLTLVEADVASLKPGVRLMDLGPIREQLAAVEQETPREVLNSPLDGAEIMDLLGLEAGPEVGRLKSLLTEKVIEGELAPGDKAAAAEILRQNLS